MVSIATVGTRTDFIGTRPRVGGGTGFIVTEEGHVVTNYHVIAGSQLVRVATDDGRILEAELVGHDPRTDLAVLKIKEDGPFPTVTFADPDAVAVGDWVIAIGNALGTPRRAHGHRWSRWGFGADAPGGPQLLRGPHSD